MKIEIKTFCDNNCGKSKTVNYDMGYIYRHPSSELIKEFTYSANKIISGNGWENWHVHKGKLLCTQCFKKSMTNIL